MINRWNWGPIFGQSLVFQHVDFNYLQTNMERKVASLTHPYGQTFSDSLQVNWDNMTNIACSRQQSQAKRTCLFVSVKYMAVCQNLVLLVNIKIAGKWMFIPLKMVLIGIDPYPYVKQKTAGHAHSMLIACCTWWKAINCHKYPQIKSDMDSTPSPSLQRGLLVLTLTCRCRQMRCERDITGIIWPLGITNVNPGFC